jgi:hypothetical protein
MGLDGLKLLVALFGVCLLAGCGSGRPKQLLYGQAAAEFRPVAGSVISIARGLDAATLGGRFSLCAERIGLRVLPRSTLVVERIGVFSESLTFRDPRGRTLYACDGGVDPAGENQPPWCGVSVAVLQRGRLLDPRLDVLCRTKHGHALAYAWIEPIAGSHWIGVDQGSYSEMFEAAGGVPVRVATRRNIVGSHATFAVTQYDVHGRELVKGTIEAAVAG